MRKYNIRESTYQNSLAGSNSVLQFNHCNKQV
jgi:hypothetical protein